MAATNTFDPGIVFDDTTLTPAVSATGVLLNAAGGTSQQVYDLNGNPISQLITNSKGYVSRFKAGIAFGVISFGSVLQPVVSIEALQSGPAAAAAAASAAAAAASAEASAQLASQATASAPDIGNRLNTLELQNTATNALVARKVDIIRWSGSGWPPRPAGALAGLVYWSCQDPNAPAPTGAFVGDVWRRHPDAA